MLGVARPAYLDAMFARPPPPAPLAPRTLFSVGENALATLQKACITTLLPRIALPARLLYPAVPLALSQAQPQPAQPARLAPTSTPPLQPPACLAPPIAPTARQRPAFNASRIPSPKQEPAASVSVLSF